MDDALAVCGRRRKSDWSLNRLFAEMTPSQKRLFIYWSAD
jgi:hypothetical protein